MNISCQFKRLTRNLTESETYFQYGYSFQDSFQDAEV